MPESLALVEASERGGVLESTIGREGMEKDLGHLQILCILFSQILGSCPLVFLCPREEVWGVEW